MASPRTYILQAAGVDVVVERKAVRRINLRVRPDGRARMSVPPTLTRPEAQAFLEAHASWLAGAIGRAEARASERARQSDAGSVPLWGELVRWDGDPADLWKQELAARLPAIAERAQAALGVRASAWQLREMTSRWGSCTPATGRIRINTRLAAYPKTCLEYVVAHELAHLIEPSHNARFHAVLAKAYPNERAARAILRRDSWEIARDG